MTNYGSTNIITIVGDSGGGTNTVWAKAVNGEYYGKGEKGFLDTAASLSSYTQNITGEPRTQFLLFINNTQCCAIYHYSSTSVERDRPQGFYIFNEKTDVFDYSDTTYTDIYHGNIRCTKDGKWLFERGRYNQCDIVGESVKHFPSADYTYLGEGYVLDKSSRQFGTYDLNTDTFIQSGTLPITLSGVAIKVGNYIVGQIGTYSKTNYVFDISSMASPTQTFKSSAEDNYYLTQTVGNLVFYYMYNGRSDGDGPFITPLYRHNIIRKLTADGRLEDYPIPEELAPYVTYKWLYNPLNNILTCAGPADYKVFYVDETNEKFTLLNVDLGVTFSATDALIMLSFSNDMKYAALTASTEGSSSKYDWDTSKRYLFKLVKADGGFYAYKSATHLGDTLLTGFATGNVDSEGRYEFETVLPDTINVTLTVNPDVTDDEFKVIKVDVQ